jgi:hypothetical protein
MIMAGEIAEVVICQRVARLDTKFAGLGHEGLLNARRRRQRRRRRH